MPFRFSPLRLNILILIVYCLSIAPVSAQHRSADYRIVFGWESGGDVERLARRAAAIQQFDDTETMVISFGNLLGDTRIVRYEEGRRYLISARDAGIDYVIPATGEFLFGREMLTGMSAGDSYPQYVAANIIDEQTRKPLFTPFITRRIGGTTICIIPLADPDIIRASPDDHVAGIDIISYTEAIDAVYPQVMLEYPDVVILAGRLARDDILAHITRFPFINLYLTNHESGGFAADGATTRSITVAGRPVYVGTDDPDRLSVLTVRTENRITATEFVDIALGDEYPVHDGVAGELNSILETLRERDKEEAVIAATGRTVAETLLEGIDADVAILERQSLYYYPIEDSLTVTNVGQVIRPGIELDQYTLKGSLLKSIRERSNEEKERSKRLLFGGLTAEGKVDSIPLQDDREYTLLTTRFLRDGGHGYEEFTEGGQPVLTGIDLRSVVEEYLVEKEERIREASKPKYWKLNLYLTLNSNYERSTVNQDKDLYGNSIPKPFRTMEDTYTGTFLLSSQNNLLTYNREIGPHRLEHELKFSYSREGKRTDDSDRTIYTDQKNHDPVEQFNKYTYRVKGFPAEPYVDLRFVSVLYSGGGRHPLTATMSTGATKTFPRLLGLNVAVGLQATRDYVIPENDFGTKSTISFQHTFPAKSLFSKDAAFRSRTNIFWTPVAKYNMEFKMDSDSNLVIQLWKRINAQFTVRAYSYRNSIHKKLALGFYYNFTLNYGMTWDF